MTYEEWEATVFPEIKNDSLWKVEAYRLGLFASDLGWYDVTKLMQDRRTLAFYPDADDKLFPDISLP